MLETIYFQKGVVLGFFGYIKIPQKIKMLSIHTIFGWTLEHPPDSEIQLFRGLGNVPTGVSADMCGEDFCLCRWGDR